MENLLSALNIAIEHGPSGLLLLFFAWRAYSNDKEKDAKSEEEKTSFEPVVEAFKTVVETNTKLFNEQNATLNKLSGEIEKDREFHRDAINKIVNNHVVLEKKLDVLETDLDSIAASVQEIAKTAKSYNDHSA